MVICPATGWLKHIGHKPESRVYTWITVSHGGQSQFSSGKDETRKRILAKGEIDFPFPE
jgi:hypothetical protein